MTLLGQNVNSYGARSGRFADVLEIVACPRPRWKVSNAIRFTSPHPKDFRADSVAAMAECASVCEHIHLPVEAGLGFVPKRMKRADTRAQVPREGPDGSRGDPRRRRSRPDIIVGFPGETEEEFARELTLVAEARYDQAFTFQYSPRPDDRRRRSSRTTCRRPSSQERFDRLIALAERHIAGVEPEDDRQQTMRFVVEGPSKKDARRSSGRTRTEQARSFSR